MLHTVLVILTLSSAHIKLISAKVQIQSLFVPRFIENGTEDSVVLDCVYKLDPIDDQNLVVKWFLNDDPEPIYQWIPEHNARHASKRLQGRINMDFTVDTVDPLTKYRAINILRPTIDLSGKYSCHVMSLSSQDSREETMIVFAKPKMFDFNYTRTTDKENNNWSLRTRKGTHKMIPSDQSEQSPPHQHQSPSLSSYSDFVSAEDPLGSAPSSSATLNCHVHSVFPLPEMSIYRVNDGDKPQVLTEIDQNVERNTHSGAYNVTLSSVIRDSDLLDKYGSEINNFECLLILPDGSVSHYQRKKRVTYLTEKSLLNQSNIIIHNFSVIYSIISSFVLFLLLRNIS